MHPENPHLPPFLLLCLAAAAALAASLSDGEIKIRWSGLPSPDGLDYVAVYSPPSSRDRDFLGYLFLNGSSTWREGRGELSLPLLPTLRAPYQFRLFRWPAEEYSYSHTDHDRNPLPRARGRHRAAAASADVSVGDPARPQQVHLAFADAADEMRVLFLCGDAGVRVVRYGLLGEGGEREWTEVGTEVRTYERKHMCDSPANSSVAWRDPGFVFDGLMKGLQPGRKYFYKVYTYALCISSCTAVNLEWSNLSDNFGNLSNNFG
jgi:hypothetical protein